MEGQTKTEIQRRQKNDQGVEMTEDKLTVGTRVVRVVADLARGGPSRIRRGVVTRAYNSMPSETGQSTRLYAVRWDDTGNEEVGYLDGNLEPEPIA